MDDLINLDTAAALAANLSLAKKLAAEGFKVIVVKYDIATGSIANMIKNLAVDAFWLDCNSLNNQEAKARMEEYSLKAFHDWRKILKNRIDSADYYQIDTGKVFVSGISAGAVLTLYGVYLDSEEILDTISYYDCSNTLHHIYIDSTVRQTAYPVHKVAGIISMAGGSFYKDIFTNNSAVIGENGIPVYLMHGTCDELINQDSGRVSYKHLRITFIPPLTFIYNQATASRYPHVYGSSTIFDILKTTGTQIGYGQVCAGGYSIFINDSINQSTNHYPGGWDFYHTTDTSHFLNPTDPVFDNIMLFTNSVLQLYSTPEWTTSVRQIIPERFTKGCIDDPQEITSITGVAAFGGNFCSIAPAFFNQDSVKISGGGEGGKLYRWKIADAVDWTLSTQAFCYVDCETITEQIYSYSNGVFTYYVPVRVQSINGCDTVEYYKNNVPFIVVCPVCREGDEEVHEQELEIRYNPYTSDMQFFSNKEVTVSIMLSNLSGQLLMNKKQLLYQGWNDADGLYNRWHTLPAGMYILSVYTSRKIFSEKLIKY